MSNRHHLHELVEDLPEADLDAVSRYLERLVEQARDPVTEALAAAPIDDEPVSAEEWAQIDEALEHASRGETMSDQDLERHLRLVE